MVRIVLLRIKNVIGQRGRGGDNRVDVAVSIPSAFIMYTSPSMVDEWLCRRTVSGVDGACGDVGDCLQGDRGGG